MLLINVRSIFPLIYFCSGLQRITREMSGSWAAKRSQNDDLKDTAKVMVHLCGFITEGKSSHLQILLGLLNTDYGSFKERVPGQSTVGS